MSEASTRRNAQQGPRVPPDTMGSGISAPATTAVSLASLRSLSNVSRPGIVPILVRANTRKRS